MQNNKVHANIVRREQQLMAMLTIRRIPDETHRALKHRAQANGRSVEEEVRQILRSEMFPVDRRRLGDALTEISSEYQLTSDEERLFEDTRDTSPATPMGFN